MEQHRIRSNCYSNPAKFASGDLKMSTTQRSVSSTQSRLSTVPASASKSRQLSHLHAQLAQLTAHMSDLENLLRMTAVQEESMRGLGGYVGGMYVGYLSPHQPSV